jgi:uncharacterized protein (DUF2141 family)
MMAKNSPVRAMRILFAALAVIFLAACASIGRPEGGARDEDPPKYTRSNPSPGELHVSRTQIDVWFDENIQLDDAFNKVIVSPAQVSTPVVRSQGKHLSVELRDTLLPNTTYTIDFADAIKDLNEGNVLDGFALDFSTGDDIDTLRVSGVVLEARTLEPAQGITVGLFDENEMTDTTLTNVPFRRVARTNTYGQFTIRNLKPGNYKVFALNDLNRDNKWDRSEDIAFIDGVVSPYVENITVNDTLRNDADQDSIVTRPGVAYYPNDVLLTWFNENYQAQYLKDYTRPDRNRVSINMGAKSDTLPSLTIVGGAHNGDNILNHSLLQRNATNDSLTYWLRTPEVLGNDSLRLAVCHQAVDSLQQIVWQTDTLKFFWKEPKVKDKKKKKEEEADSVPEIEFTSFAALTQQNHEVYLPLKVKTTVPIDTIDVAGIHLEMMPDTVWIAAKHTDPVPDPDNPLFVRQIDFDRTPGMKYRLTVDSAAVTDIYGLYNKPFKHEFTVKKMEDYANLVFNISPTDTLPYVVELLSSSDSPVRTLTAEGGKVSFTNIAPGTYYARMFIDRNANGEWDTGSVRDSLQPEEVYYYPKKLDLKANWDVEQSWNIYELALDAQKPKAIKKNKPKLKKGEKEAKDENEDVELDEWGEPIDRSNNSTKRGSSSLGNGRLRTTGGDTYLR